MFKGEIYLRKNQTLCKKSLEKNVEHAKTQVFYGRNFNAKAKLGVADIKLINKDKDRRVVEYVKSHKTQDVYAFSIEEISEAKERLMELLEH